MKQKKHLVLVVEDDPAVGNSISSGLQEAGFDVQVAENGLEALKKIGKPLPNVIISEIEMPGMSGQNLIFLARHRFPQVPFILLAGAMGPEQRQTLSEGEADAVFQREGLSIRDLCQKVSELIRTGPKRKENTQAFRRRCERFLRRIPIEVSGVTAGGERFVERTTTIMISAFGGSISLGQELSPDQPIHIRNLSNEMEEEFRVVSLVTVVFGTRREYGVELLNPDSQIWGIKFEVPPKTEQLGALMECAECRRVTMVDLSASHFSLLLQMGAISLHCEPCDRTTRWQPAKAHDEATAAEGATAATKRLIERRKSPRHRLTMLVSVRRSRGGTEREQVLDVSRSGLCFTSKRTYEIGDVLGISLPTTSGEDRKGRIVWKQSKESRHLYGVQFV